MTWKSVAENLVWLAFSLAGLIIDRRGWPMVRTVFHLSGRREIQPRIDTDAH